MYPLYCKEGSKTNRHAGTLNVTLRVASSRVLLAREWRTVSTPGFGWRWGSMECWGDWGQLIWVQSWSLAQPQLCCKEPEEALASITHQKKKSTLCSLSCSGLDVSQQQEVLVSGSQFWQYHFFLELLRACLLDQQYHQTRPTSLHPGTCVISGCSGYTLFLVPVFIAEIMQTTCLI